MAMSLGMQLLPQEPEPQPRFFFTVAGNKNSEEVVKRIDELGKGRAGQKKYLCVVFPSEEEVSIPGTVFAVAIFDSDGIGRKQLSHLLPSSRLFPAWGKPASRGVAISSAHNKVQMWANQIFANYVESGVNGPRLGHRRGWESRRRRRGWQLD